MKHLITDANNIKLSFEQWGNLLWLKVLWYVIVTNVSNCIRVFSRLYYLRHSFFLSPPKLSFYSIIHHSFQDQSNHLNIVLFHSIISYGLPLHTNYFHRTSVCKQSLQQLECLMMGLYSFFLREQMNFNYVVVITREFSNLWLGGSNCILCSRFVWIFSIASDRKSSPDMRLNIILSKRNSTCDKEDDLNC